MSGEQAPDQERITIAWQNPAIMQIGKSGLTEGVIREAKRLLKEHRYIKVRILRTALGGDLTKEGLVEGLCERTGARLAGIRGNTAVVYRLRHGRRHK